MNFTHLCFYEIDFRRLFGVWISHLSYQRHLPIITCAAEGAIIKGENKFQPAPHIRTKWKWQLNIYEVRVDYNRNIASNRHLQTKHAQALDVMFTGSKSSFVSLFSFFISDVKSISQVQALACNFPMKVFFGRPRQYINLKIYWILEQCFLEPRICLRFPDLLVFS